jgi:molecular chaperone HtpG
MDIPDRLAQKIEQNSALHGAILQTLAEFKPWFDTSKTPFFPEYTDHNWSHVTQTMATASALIQEEAWPLITSTDAAVLVLAVVLHDCGMHLTEDGFLALIADESNKRALPGWTERPWSAQWSDFLSDASRFDARKLYALFGDTDPVHRPADDPKLWTLRDRLLIGDFIRRQHPRLAHEVALHGVPGPGPTLLGLKGVPTDLADLAGLVARSHGLAIRACLPHLKRFDLRDYKGTHAVFLMATLRVADYLQIQAERAPEGFLKVQQLRSPLSQKEWNTHGAVRDIRHTHADPEAIEVDAAPKDVVSYVRLKKLLHGIQGELDASWAVLGEIYGRFGLKDLGLRLRRVRSNIDDEAEFAKTVPYLPCEAAFDAEGPELLKLLIRPLYGDHPEIGIRELTQNAVDACRELKDYLDQNPATQISYLTTQEEDVLICLEDRGENGRWLEVRDRGIGMTADVIRKYFLKAGASFRRSDAWRRMHETSEGESRVLRSGRFGVGVLSAFLLGNKVEVSTRSITAGPDKGITFEATIDTEEIELRFCSRPVGTTVRVRIDEKEVWDSLSKTAAGLISWDWYCLADPKVARVVLTSGKQESLTQRFSLPDVNAPLGHEWRRVGHPGYSDIQWSYWDGPFLACNGIIVTALNPMQRYYYDEGPTLGSSGHLNLNWPHVSVFDPDGHLPLVLQRNALASQKYPFQEKLFADIIRDLLAYLLVLAPQHLPSVVRHN